MLVIDETVHTFVSQLVLATTIAEEPEPNPFDKQFRWISVDCVQTTAKPTPLSLSTVLQPDRTTTATPMDKR